MILGSRRSPREGKDNPTQYFYLGNPMDTGVWQVTWSLKELYTLSD